MQYAHSLARDAVLAAVRGHFVDPPYFQSHTLIHAARNDAVRVFRASDVDYLMFIDADTGWGVNALGDMLALDPALDVVAGICRRRDDVVVYPFNVLTGVPLKFPLCEIESAGACFMRITRPAIERTVARFGPRIFDYRLDPRFPETGEDMSFCWRARDAGCRVWGKFDIEFEHVGPKTWKGTAQIDMADKEGFTLGQQPHDHIRHSAA